MWEQGSEWGSESGCEMELQQQLELGWCCRIKEMAKEVSGRTWSEGSEAQRNSKKRQCAGHRKRKRRMQVVRGK